MFQGDNEAQNDRHSPVGRGVGIQIPRPAYLGGRRPDAGVVVGKIGTAVCAGRELMEFYRMLASSGMDVVRRS